VTFEKFMATPTKYANGIELTRREWMKALARDLALSGKIYPGTRENWGEILVGHIQLVPGTLANIAYPAEGKEWVLEAVVAWHEDAGDNRTFVVQVKRDGADSSGITLIYSGAIAASTGRTWPHGDSLTDQPLTGGRLPLGYGNLIMFYIDALDATETAECYYWYRERDALD
jgi:hypothetical protein